MESVLVKLDKEMNSLKIKIRREKKTSTVCLVIKLRKPVKPDQQALMLLIVKLIEL